LTKDLLQETGEKYPRGFKKENNTVGNSFTTPYENVSQEISSLLSYYQSKKIVLFPLQMAFDFHLRFEKIHPFVNGNGRVGRMLMNKILLANNYLPMVIFAENRQAYFNAIKSTEDGNTKKYYKFMLEQYDKSLKFFQEQAGDLFNLG